MDILQEMLRDTHQKNSTKCQSVLLERINIFYKNGHRFRPEGHIYVENFTMNMKRPTVAIHSYDRYNFDL